jgi:hypothetical protein
MAVRNRRSSPEDRNEAIEAFGAQAEKPPVTGARTGLPAWKARMKSGAKNKGYNVRFNQSQHDLLTYASEVEEKSQQKLIEELLWPILEERYGRDVP